VVESNGRKKMALGDATIAIVASNLTAARCSLIGGFAENTDERKRADQETVETLFAYYLKRLQAGETTHPPSP